MREEVDVSRFTESDVPTPGVPPGDGLARLPNGMTVSCQSRVELEHFYEDIFEKRIYADRGLHLDEQSVVFDVGANIGLFTLFVQATWPGARVWSFEPAPPIFAHLRYNAALNAPRTRLLNCGVSSEPGEATFTFYPRSSGMSSFFADAEEERRALDAVLANEARRGGAAAQALLEHREDYLAERLEAIPYTCPLVTLSQVIRDHRLERVDLVKIDVQKAEMLVLDGIAEEDWPKIGQLVVEVHDFEGRRERMTRRLEGLGFRVEVVQDEMYLASEMFNLYAIRPGWATRAAAAPPPGVDQTERAARERAARQRAVLDASTPPVGRRRPTRRRR